MRDVFVQVILTQRAHLTAALGTRVLRGAARFGEAFEKGGEAFQIGRCLKA